MLILLLANEVASVRLSEHSDKLPSPFTERKDVVPKSLNIVNDIYLIIKKEGTQSLVH